MATDRVHLSVAEARAHSERALRGIGYDAEEARIISDHALDAALCEYSGMAKFLNIPKHRRFKRPRHAMKVQQIGALIDRIKPALHQPGVDEIRIPGERAFRSRERALRDGIEIDRVVYEALKSLHLD